MSAYNNPDKIIAMIEKIDEQIETAIKASQYSITTGQSSQTKQSQSLRQLKALREYYISILESEFPSYAASGGLIYVRYEP